MHCGYPAETCVFIRTLTRHGFPSICVAENVPVWRSIPYGLTVGAYKRAVPFFTLTKGIKGFGTCVTHAQSRANSGQQMSFREREREVVVGCGVDGFETHFLILRRGINDDRNKSELWVTSNFMHQGGPTRVAAHHICEDEVHRWLVVQA